MCIDGGFSIFHNGLLLLFSESLARSGSGYEEVFGVAADGAFGGGGSPPAEVAAEEVLRANTYALLARLLRTQPDAEALSEFTRLQTGDTEMGRALTALAEAARDATPETVSDEFHDLFIGVGETKLTPYTSYYLTGFVYEKPLAKVRLAMAALGISQGDDVAEPEDHIAALCEVMCGLITGAFGEPVALAAQSEFFDTHIAPWAERFFEDLENSPSAKFYKSVGRIGKLFMKIESQAFEMAA